MWDEIHTDALVKEGLQTCKELFIPRYVGDSMDMVRLYSWEDYEALPMTSWKIKQPADDEVRENALHTGLVQAYHQSCLL
jgi:5-formyltetrahydrofolate cyclo-ligase